jgi:poly(3-hydroxyoctanoate) depolymerase
MALSSASIRLSRVCGLILLGCSNVACAPRTGDGGGSVVGGSVDPSPTAGEPGELQPAGGSRCSIDATTGDIACTRNDTTIGGRAVSWQTPLGMPPAAGWPIVFVFQGSFFGPSVMWSAKKNDLLGILGSYTQTLLLKRLLDGGYVVVTPAADINATAWDTNLVPWRDLWPPAPDNNFLVTLFAAVDGGGFGAIDPDRWYATGVSSGGYMTSRMAVSYPGRFRALAVAAGSYATCGGVLCAVPAVLPADHPPTLFVHGGADPIVPIFTMYAYRDALAALGHTTSTVVDPTFMHGWIPATPDAVGAWFDTH